MSHHNFRYLPMLFLLAAIGLPLAGLWIAWGELSGGEPIRPRGMVIGAGAGFVAGSMVCAIGAWFLQAVMFTTVGPAGIRGWTFWNFRRSMSWEEAQDLRPLELPGVPFVRICSVSGGMAIWQPLFLVDPQAFVKAVSLGAGAEHPLSVFLRERLDAGST